MKSVFGLAVIAATLTSGTTHNDWSKPCFDGECAYDLPDHRGQSGSVKLFADSPSAIADITPAAGWVVLDCDPHALVQQIRLVCGGDAEEGSGCGHLFSGVGPVDKYVRLPESCSSSPFARITNYWVHEDQSVPSHHGIARRNGASPLPQVFAISIDDRFDLIDYSTHGDVNFVAYGINAPGLDINLAIPSIFDSEDSIDSFLNEAVQAMSDGGSERYLTPPDKTPPKIEQLTAGKDEEMVAKNSTLSKFGDASKAWGTFEVKSEKQACSVGSVAITGTVESYFWGQLNFGAATVGKKGKVSKFLGFFSGVEANMKQDLSLSIALTGKLSFEYETPAVTVPGVTGITLGVVTLGLMGSVKAEGNVNAEVSAEFKGSIEYGLHAGVITLPSKAKVEPYFKPGKFEAKLGADKKAKAGIEVALTPKLHLGVVTAGAKTNVTAFAAFEGKIAVEIEAKNALVPKKGKRSADEHHMVLPPSDKRQLAPHIVRDTQTIDVADDIASSICGTVKLTLDGHVGAEASFLGIGGSIKGSFWKYELELYKFGGGCGGNKRRSLARRKETHPVKLTKKELTCPLSPLKEAVEVLKQTVLDPAKIKVLKKG